MRETRERPWRTIPWLAAAIALSAPGWAAAQERSADDARPVTAAGGPAEVRAGEPSRESAGERALLGHGAPLVRVRIGASAGAADDPAATGADRDRTASPAERALLGRRPAPSRAPAPARPGGSGAPVDPASPRGPPTG